MEKTFAEIYDYIRSGGTGFIEMPRGLISVWGKEAVQFLDGMITNDMKTLGDGAEMLAAFPNAQGRLLAVVRILRQGDRFLIETEEATREKVFQNLFRFTFAGDFFVEDISDQFKCFSFFGKPLPGATDGLEPENGHEISYRGDRFSVFSGIRQECQDIFLPNTQIQEYFIEDFGGVGIFSDELIETLRIESGIPKYGVDMDENTIVPELGLDGMISYTKGCYIGQEIIARIHFRGHVAKQLTGLLSEPEAVATGLLPAVELTTAEGKSAGRVTSVTYSPKLDRTIALGFVRYDQLKAGTQLRAGDAVVHVTELPFID